MNQNITWEIPDSNNIFLLDFGQWYWLVDTQISE